MDSGDGFLTVHHSINLQFKCLYIYIYYIYIYYIYILYIYILYILIYIYIYKYKLISFTNFNAQFLYSLTICMFLYNPRHVSSINMPIFRRTNCIITSSGIVTVCKRLYTMPDESRLNVLLKMVMLMLETCRGL